MRPHRKTDAPALHEAVLESVAEVGRFMPWCHPAYSLADAERWVTECEEKFRTGSEFEFVIADAHDRFLGVCGLNCLNPGHRKANLGYWVRTSAAGMGVATEAARQVIGFAFSETGLARLELVCAVENLASRRVARKLGAIEEGVLHDRLWVGEIALDAVIYAVLRSRHGSAAGSRTGPRFTRPRR